MERLQQAGFGSRRRVLDFGCGVGRLTQALAGYFDQAYGVDIAASMIDQARRYNRHGERCNYVLNQAPHLRCFEDSTFDLVYSKFTLQHMPPRYVRRYLREFIRVAAPGGVIVFTLPSEPVYEGALHRIAGTIREILHQRIYWKIFRRGQPRMEMYGIPRKRVIRFLEDGGGAVIAVEAETGPGPKWESFLYFVTKPEGGAAR
jgi:ubiquinone/menaquinone biosynthesis C-methylase UbiE